MEVATAKMKGIHNLYKYQRFHRDRVADIIANQRLHLARPDTFNDPWDCAPCFNTTILDDPSMHERHIAWFERIQRKHCLALPSAEQAARIQKLRDDRAFLEQCINSISKEIGSNIADRYRVCCFSTSPSNALLWAHYASNHSGICLEFDTNNAVFEEALAVTYSKEYPHFDLTDDTMEALTPLLSKSSDWAYEEEFRLVAQERAQALNHESLITDDNFLPLPSGGLKSIILGCNASNDTALQIAQVIKTTGTSIGLKRAKRVPNRYAVEVEG
jgi:hypothetical protein